MTLPPFYSTTPLEREEDEDASTPLSLSSLLAFVDLFFSPSLSSHIPLAFLPPPTGHRPRLAVAPASSSVQWRGAPSGPDAATATASHQRLLSPSGRRPRSHTPDRRWWYLRAARLPPRPALLHLLAAAAASSSSRPSLPRVITHQAFRDLCWGTREKTEVTAEANISVVE